MHELWVKSMALHMKDLAAVDIVILYGHKAHFHSILGKSQLHIILEAYC